MERGVLRYRDGLETLTWESIFNILFVYAYLGLVIVSFGFLAWGCIYLILVIEGKTKRQKMGSAYKNRVKREQNGNSF